MSKKMCLVMIARYAIIGLVVLFVSTIKSQEKNAEKKDGGTLNPNFKVWKTIHIGTIKSADDFRKEFQNKICTLKKLPMKFLVNQNSRS